VASKRQQQRLHSGLPLYLEPESEEGPEEADAEAGDEPAGDPPRGLAPETGFKGGLLNMIT